MRILLIEDDARIAETVRRGLAGEGISVDIVDDGVDGLWAASERACYDAVVLDIMLPGLSGYKVLEGLRGREVWTPVLMLTAKDGEYDEADAFDLGADDYLTKPFSFVVLAARLRALVRRGESARPAVLSAGDLTLDPARRRVARGAREVELTPREYALLEFLIRRAGSVVSKAEILDNVWDPEFGGGDNVVEVYVRYLRRKIDEPFGRQAVRTVRGAGYMLDAEGG
ncbi:response regulator transcription factor [Nocardiopsis chromatogenes]|uniref:response regulator transcription factor n=1 Tax=Nocardiopsis chromatogenes TaxID=280239 RepID=UPI00034523FD|nr:response regulator transcription factor [Nocardiopsis chromatogenes]